MPYLAAERAAPGASLRAGARRRYVGRCRAVSKTNLVIGLLNLLFGGADCMAAGISTRTGAAQLSALSAQVRELLAKGANIEAAMGGQTALNVGIELWRNEDLQRRNIRVLGTKIDAIVATEDREIFSTKLREINETLALSYPATTVEGALEAAHKIGYPVLVRAAFTLGGLGSGFAENDAELRDLAVLTRREK